MKPLLLLSSAIDWLSDKFGWVATWTVLLSALISALNAFVRYGFDLSSNGMLEIQWYLFAWMVMVGAPLVLKFNEHVRVDLVYGMLGPKRQVWVDIFGIVLFLLPVIGFLLYLTWPYFMRMYTSGEMSQNAGGLIRWPALLAIPVGFALLWLQGVSELIKRVAHLRGDIHMDMHYEKPVQ